MMLARLDFRDVLKDIRIDSISSEAKTLAEKYGYLPYMVQRYLDMLGDEAIELLDTFERLRPSPVIRVNTLKIDTGKLIARLRDLGFDFKPIPWCSYCFRVTRFPESPSIGATHEYLKGFYYVYQDAPPTIPPLLMDVKPEMLVLDMCAAPGGKATHILQLMEDEGILIANDKARSRIPILLTHLFRMGFRSYIVTCFDGRDLPRVLNLRFDRVLVDVPCSAEGRIMFDPGRKTRTDQHDLAKLVAREIELLVSAIELTAIGGLVVYSTCSIAPEENEYVVSRVLKLYGENIEVVEPNINRFSRGLTRFRNLEFDPDVEKCLRIWPHRHGMEGFFVCVIRKKG